MPRRYAIPIKRSPKDDPQQYRVYRMENEAIGACKAYRLSKASIRSMIKSVCSNYGVPPPVVKWADLGHWAAEWRSTPSTGYIGITFNTKKGTARDALTVTHELAHHVHYHLSAGAWVKQQSHGPQFMACHMSILDARRMIPVLGMRAICKAWDVKYEDPGDSLSLPRLIRIAKGKK